MPRTPRRRAHCDFAYGFNGWLGIAGISIDSSGHIVTGYTKLNDSFISVQVNVQPARLEAERGVPGARAQHRLDHQDEDFDNVSLFSCMDSRTRHSSFPTVTITGSSKQFTVIWIRLDSVSGGSAGGGGTCNSPPGRAATRRARRRTRQVMPGGSRWVARARRERFLRIRSRRNAPHHPRDLGCRSLTLTRGHPSDAPCQAARMPSI